MNKLFYLGLSVLDGYELFVHGFSTLWLLFLIVAMTGLALQFMDDDKLSGPPRIAAGWLVILHALAWIAAIIALFFHYV